MKNLSLGWLVMAAALTIGMTACSSADSIAEEPVQQPENPAKKTYTMTVTASKGGDDSALARAMAEAGLTGDATTRALTLSSDGKTLDATWAEGETVTVMSIDPSTYAYVNHGTLTAQSDGAETTLSGELTGTINVGDVLYLNFHDGRDLGAAQDGTLQYIADNLDYDWAIVTVKEIVDGNITINEDAAVFEHKVQAIVRFTLVDKADPTKRLKPSTLTISQTVESWTGPTQVNYKLDGLTDATYEANAYAEDNGDGVVYAALEGMSGTNFTLTATMPTGEIYEYVRPSVTFEAGQFYSITVKMTDDFDLSKVSHDMTLGNGATLTGTLGGNYKLTIADGATVTLNGVTINGTNSESYKWAGLNCLGDATIVLADGSTNTVKGFHRNYPGIHVTPGHTLTIQGSGALTATSNGYGAGIGGGSNIDCGNIVITGGNITANGRGDAAGIGGGLSATCGTITISGGTVKATTINGGAGIGSGALGSCDAITICGTAGVTATGDVYGAGIGSGQKASCGTITISGGAVSATGGMLAPGIGSGTNSASCDGVIITTGVTSVTATKGADESGNSAPYSIGNGYGSTCGTVTIGCTLDGSGNPVGGTTGPVSDSPYTYTPGN